jgi:hypothetical protein
MYDRRTAASGHLRPEALQRLILQYVPVPGYDVLVSRLQDARLLVLRGAPGTGRTTSGLAVLAEVSDEKVSRFGPDTDIGRLPDLEAGFGYLIEMIPGRGKTAITAADADRLRQQLTDRGCYMVVVVPNDVRYQAAFEDYAAGCPLPDPQQVLTRVIEHEMRESPQLAGKLRELLSAAPLGAFAGPELPSEARWAAALLVSCAPGEMTAAQVSSRAGESLSRYVAGWFEPLAQSPSTGEADELVRLAAFRIALAVFHQTPFDVVPDAAEELATRLMRARSPRRRPGRAVFANYRDDYLTDSRGRLVPDSVWFGKASVPSLFAGYADDRMPGAVLRHVWGMYSVRSQILRGCSSSAATAARSCGCGPPRPSASCAHGISPTPSTSSSSTGQPPSPTSHRQTQRSP